MFPVHDSYPTVTGMKADFAYQNWIDTLQKSFAESNSKKGSVFTYTFPFESLCTFFVVATNVTKIIV
jgi:oxygen-independent coproporphyrinogen-3 oxidase